MLNLVETEAVTSKSLALANSSAEVVLRVVLTGSTHRGMCNTMYLSCLSH